VVAAWGARCASAGLRLGPDDDLTPSVHLPPGAVVQVRLSEVKGPRDSLSEKQMAWLRILGGAGVHASVCKISEPRKEKKKQARKASSGTTQRKARSGSGADSKKGKKGGGGGGGGSTRGGGGNGGESDGGAEGGGGGGAGGGGGRGAELPAAGMKRGRAAR
jgi:hypothetical protein